MYLIIALNVFILVSGKLYLYKALYYNFVDIDDYKIFDNRTIKAGASNQEWQLSNEYNKISLPGEIDKKLEEIETVAFLIIKDDSILYEKYWDGYSDSSYSGSFSMAKSYISALIGVAIQDGYIESIDQKVSDFIPEFKEGPKDSITIRHLLTMSSGLNWYESYGNPLSITTEAYYGSDLRGLIDGLEAESEPGKQWKYLSGDTQVLSYVLKAATGKNVSEYLSEKIWKPIGCKNDGLWSLDKEGGDEKAYCCINSNARDFARFGQLYLQKGKWNGKQIVPESFVKESGTANGIGYNSSTCNHYGLHWWVYNLNEKTPMYYARGILGQYIMVFPEQNMVIVRLGHRRGKKIDGLHCEEVHMLVDWVDKEF